MSTKPADSNLQTRRNRRRTAPRRGDEQERAILDATDQLLDEHRFEALTVAMVASAAGISRPSVYFYFGSMEELLVALIRRGLNELISSIESVTIPPDATPVDVLAIGVRHTSDGWRSHGPLLRTAVDFAYRVPTIRQDWQALLERGVDLYLELMTWSALIDERPEPDTVAARRQAELCMLMVGYALHDLYETSPDEATVKQREHDLVLLVSRALELSPIGSPERR